VLPLLSARRRDLNCAELIYIGNVNAGGRGRQGARDYKFHGRMGKLHSKVGWNFYMGSSWRYTEGSKTPCLVAAPRAMTIRYAVDSYLGRRVLLGCAPAMTDGRRDDYFGGVTWPLPAKSIGLEIPEGRAGGVKDYLDCCSNNSKVTATDSSQGP